MSELLQGPAKHELLTGPERHASLPEHIKNARVETAAELEQTAEAALETANEEAVSASRIEADHGQAEASAPAQPQHVDSELKQISLRRELKSIRRKETMPQRILSNVIHQPVVRAVSEGAGKTVSRPSGLLGGGIVAFIGSSSYLYLAKHIGFTYNSGVFLVLFAGGFAVGLALELLTHMALGSHRKAD